MSDVEHHDIEEGERARSNTRPEYLGGMQSDMGKASMRSNEKLSISDRFDLEGYLRDGIRKQDESNIRGRELGVAFRGLRVTGLGNANTAQPTVGSTFNPLEIPKGIAAARHPIIKDILSGFEGAVRPGEMLLVLGKPGSGCTTLLKTIANQHTSFKSVEGTIAFSSLSPEEVSNHYRGDVLYVPEDDQHFPTLTVGQTLKFAAKSRAPGAASRAGESRQGFVSSITDTLQTVFGLKHVQNTVVGDAVIRGVSGGEKKRVSIAEALAIRHKLAAWDNSTRGLDSSTALEFIQALRIETDVNRLTTIVSIYQVSESIYELFDKVCVVSEGKMIYFGRAREARQYFIDMGYEPASRQTTADYLVAVTDPHGRSVRQGFEARAPRTSEEMGTYFQRHPFAQNNREDVDAFLEEHTGAKRDALTAAYRESSVAEHSKQTRASSPYLSTISSQVREVFIRRAQILRGDFQLQSMTVIIYVFQSIIMGTMFFRLPEATSGYFSRGGVIFFSLLFGGVASMGEIPALYSQRPIVQKHMRSAMYHPFAEAFALTLVDLPINFIAVLIYSVVLYFLVHLQETAGQFFIFFMFLFTTNVALKAFMRTLTAMIANEAGAQAAGGLGFLLMVLYAGYAVPKPSMIGALRWLTWLNPIQYAFEGILTNEFHTLDGTCSQIVPSGPGYENVSVNNQVCAAVGAVAGQTTVSGDAFVGASFGYSHSHLWRDFGIIVGFMVFFIFTYLLFTELSSSAAPDILATLYKGGKKGPVDPADDEEKRRELGVADEKEGGHPRSIAEGAARMTDNFTWQHIEYTVPIPGAEDRRLLDDVSGYVVPGKLTALMGESGAGKTTLINVLAERTDVGVVRGDRYINGQALPRDFQSQTGYCQQMDTHLAQSTVREALMFSAVLRQPHSVSTEEKAAYVETCLRMCGMEAYADAIVGTLAVEQRKRTTIGVELAAKPRLLLFLDEPTSGLDSQSAWHIITCLRELADHGQAILCTIHQPSSELFQVFDRLLLLRKGGQTVYFGEVGPNSSTMISYFERNGARPCGQSENPAEWMLDVIGAGATATSTIDWFSAWKRSNEFQVALHEIDGIHEEGRTRPAVETVKTSRFASPWTFQATQLTKRAFQSHWRNPEYVIGKLALNIMGALLIGFTFYKAKDTLQGTQNKLFAVFMSILISFPIANQIQIPFIAFRDIFEVRERYSSMYHWTALVVSQIVVDLPYNIFASSLYSLISFWLIGLPTDRFGYNFLTYAVVFPIYYQTVAQVVASFCPDAILANLLFGAIQSFTFVFDGVFQPYALLGWWKWMYRVSPLTYVTEGLVGSAVGRQLVECSSVELVTLQPPSGQTCMTYLNQFISEVGGFVTNPDATSDCQFCSARTTDQWLALNFNIFYDHRWRNVGIILGFSVLNIVAMFAFTYFVRVRKGSLIGSLKAKLSKPKA